MKKLLSALSVFLIFSQLVYSAAAPTPYNAYDGIYPGARALAAGYAFSAVYGDPSAVYFNPAGLYGIEENLISFSWDVARQSDLDASLVFANEPIRQSSLMFLSFCGQKGAFTWRPLCDTVRTSSSGADWNKDEVKIFAIGFSAAQKNESNVITGINLNYLNGRTAHSSITGGIPESEIAEGNGFSMDIGFLVNPSPMFSFGLDFKNLLGTMWWDKYDKEQLPFAVRGGWAIHPTNLTTLSADFEKTYYRNENPGPDETIKYVGIEQGLGNIMKFGVGMFGSDLNEKDKVHYTGGITYVVGWYQFSLAGEKYTLTEKDVTRYVFSLNIPLGSDVTKTN